jgi:hypothetical protein
VTRRRVSRYSVPVNGFRQALDHLGVAQAILGRYRGVVGVAVGFERKRGSLRPGRAAYVVHVSRKRDPRSSRDRLPDELFGVPIDVVQRGAAGPRFSSGCFAAPAANTDDYGHLGLIAKDPSGATVGLTVGHVAVPGTYPLTVSGGSQSSVMDCWNLADDPERAGSLVEAYFAPAQDIALIALAPADPSKIDPRLDGKVKAGVPRPITALLSPPLAVQLVIPGMTTWPLGRLTEVGYRGRFDTKSQFGDDTFSGLCTFEFPALDEIEPGWSGSLICDLANRPLALLSFGAVVRSDADSAPSPTVWAWPMSPHYSFWRLGPA